MGYYTRFEGGVTGPPELLEVFKEDTEAGKTYGQYDQLLQDWIDGEFFGGDTAKWYGWQEDMKSLSKEYPNLLFSLQGEGEESGDIWKAWARNGKVVRSEARIVFDEPDLDKALPSADVDAAIAKRKEAIRIELQSKIAKLKSQLEEM